MEGSEDEHTLGALTAPGVFLEPAVAAFEHRKILGITGKQAGDLQFVQGTQEAEIVGSAGHIATTVPLKGVLKTEGL